MKPGDRMKKYIIPAAVFLLISCGSNEVKTVIKAFSGSIKINGSAIPGVGLIQLKRGDIIETAGNSFCDIMIDDKKIIRIRDNSRIICSLTSGENLLNVDRGLITVVTKEKFSYESRYRIITPAVEVSIKGRSFCVKVEGDKSTYICLCSGRINITGVDHTSDNHKSWKFIRSDDGNITMEPDPGMLYHNDFGIEQMARIIKE